METWTVRKQLNDRFRLRINFGAKAFWCEFDYVVSYLPTVIGVEVIHSSSPELARWFPFLKRGIEQAVQELYEEGKQVTSLKGELTQIYTHPVDTTAEGCVHYGRSFLYWLVREHGVKVL